jgi:hypothetical protein
MECSKFCRAVCCHIVRLHKVQVGVHLLDLTALIRPHWHWHPSNAIEHVVDNCFDRGDGEVGERCENVVEPVRLGLDAGDVGK